jgi:hypothetical protein
MCYRTLHNNPSRNRFIIDIFKDQLRKQNEGIPIPQHPSPVRFARMGTEPRKTGTQIPSAFEINAVYI